MSRGKTPWLLKFGFEGTSHSCTSLLLFQMLDPFEQIKDNLLMRIGSCYES
jgi:hypothetical protein